MKVAWDVFHQLQNWGCSRDTTCYVRMCHLNWDCAIHVPKHGFMRGRTTPRLALLGETPDMDRYGNKDQTRGLSLNPTLRILDMQNALLMASSTFVFFGPIVDFQAFFCVCEIEDISTLWKLWGWKVLGHDTVSFSTYFPDFQVPSRFRTRRDDGRNTISSPRQSSRFHSKLRRLLRVLEQSARLVQRSLSKRRPMSTQEREYFILDLM